MDIYMFIKLFGGLVFFMFGMKTMSQSLEKMAGGKLEHLLKKMTANPFISIFLGAVITIAMQSSSATTVMLVGLVNSGLMKFGQTVSVIFGANIGTTLTSWILALSGINSDNFALNMMKPEYFAPVLAVIGTAFIMVSKDSKKINIATVAVGFDVLIYGMEMMKDAVSPLADSQAFKDALVRFENPVVAVLIGLGITAVIQASAASIGMLQAIAMSTGLITYNLAVPLVMGINIGTCATSLISCIGTKKNAKRVAVLHVSIKIIGTIFWLAVYEAVKAIFAPAFMSNYVNMTSIALIHTVYNILTTLLLFPFQKLLVCMVEKMLPDKADENGSDSVDQQFAFLDDRLLNSPSVAISECNNLTNSMCEIARSNLLNAMSLFDDYDEKTVQEVIRQEDVLDRYEDKLSAYLTHLASCSTTEYDSRVISKMLHTIGDFERLGDHALNLSHAAEEIHTKNLKFTLEARSELKVLTAAIREILDLTTGAYMKSEVDTASMVEPLEQVIDKLTQEIKSNHITRLQQGGCSIVMGFILSDMLTDYERISDHCSNVAIAVIEEQKGSFDTHAYLNGMKYGNVEFNSAYDAYNAKYYL